MLNGSGVFNVQSAAKYLGVSPKTIRRWAQTGCLKGVKIGPRGDWRFTKKQLDELVKKP